MQNGVIGLPRKNALRNKSLFNNFEIDNKFMESKLVEK